MRVPVTGLVGHPGETRELCRAVSPEEFGPEPWGVAEDGVEDPLVLDLHLDAVVEGILVRGSVRFAVSLPCGRCLELQRLEREAPVMELYLDPRKREEGDDEDPEYELIDDLTAIDLTPLVRDALVVDLPLKVVCREDCQGLCPSCGGNRNETDCGHQHGDEPDPRWAKLAELELPADRSGN